MVIASISFTIINLSIKTASKSDLQNYRHSGGTLQKFY